MVPLVGQVKAAVGDGELEGGLIQGDIAEVTLASASALAVSSRRDGVPPLPQHLDPVRLGHHDIPDDAVVIFHPRISQRLLAIVHRIHSVMAFSQQGRRRREAEDPLRVIPAPAGGDLTAILLKQTASQQEIKPHRCAFRACGA